MLSQCECYPIFHQEDYQGSHSFIFFIRKYLIISRDRRDKPLQVGQHAVHEEAQLLHLQGGESLLLHQDYQQNVHLQTGTPLLFTARLI